MYREYVITPCASGFGEYEQGTESSEGYTDETDLLDAIADNGIGLYRLGRDRLPSEIEDIRGRIHGQRGDIYGYLDSEGWTRYLAIEAD